MGSFHVSILHSTCLYSSCRGKRQTYVKRQCPAHSRCSIIIPTGGGGSDNMAITLAVVMVVMRMTVVTVPVMRMTVGDQRAHKCVLNEWQTMEARGAHLSPLHTSQSAHPSWNSWLLLLHHLVFPPNSEKSVGPRPLCSGQHRGAGAPPGIASHGSYYKPSRPPGLWANPPPCGPGSAGQYTLLQLSTHLHLHFLGIELHLGLHLFGSNGAVTVH